MIRASARWLRRVVGLVLAVAVFASLAAGMLAWQLAQGPVAVPALARLIEARAVAAGFAARLEIGRAELVWEGFGEAVDRPFDIRLKGVRALDPAGEVLAEIPEAAVSLGLRALLLGRIEPRAVELRRPRLTLRRAEDGRLAVDLGAPEGGTAEGEETALAALVLAELGAQAGRRWSGALQRVRIRGAELAVIDRQLGATWHIPDAMLDLRRHDGTVAVALAGVAVAGEARLGLAAQGTLGPDGAGSLEIAFAPLTPAALAAALPALAPLSALDAPLSASATIALAPGLVPAGGEIRARLEAGRVLLPQGGALPITAAHAALRLAEGTVGLREARLVLPGRDGPSPTITARGTARGEADGWTVELDLALDRVAFADLPALWPEGLGPGERAWITSNITAGMVTAARVRLGLRIDAEGGMEAIALTGEIAAEDATVHYLRPMPPVTGVAATATLGLDQITVTARGGAAGAVRVTEARILLSGLDTRPQWAEIAVGIAAPLPAALELLAHPKLALFARRPPPPAGIAGEAEIDLALRFPLLDALTVEEIEARARARLAGVRVPEAVLGRPLTDGRVTLEATEAGLRMEGTGRLAGLAAAFGYEADFRPGPASQVIERASLRLAPQEGVAAAFGLDLAPFVTGPIGGEARLAVRRDRQATLALRADLARARLSVPALGWAKPEGAAAAAEATLRFAGARLVAAELSRLEGPGLAGRARAGFGRDGTLARIEIPSLRLGETRLAGEVEPPAQPGAPWRARVQGSVLDLSQRPRRGAESGEPGPPVALEARFDRVLLGPGRAVQEATVSLRHDGRRTEALALEARVGERGRLVAAIRPEGGARRFDLTAEDAGALLAALDITASMAGGRLAVAGRFDDAHPQAPLVGEARLEEFRLRDAPAIGRVLQAMTLYGVLELARGPGLSFSTLIAPFSLAGDTLELRDARAFGPSLGFTARGTIDFGQDRLALEGTIVPAYVFNSLLGHIPLIGRLFAPERGGGVFAATYRVRGSFADPEVTVNPLAALTPGFLRGLFGLFEGGEAPAAPAEAPRGGG